MEIHLSLKSTSPTSRAVNPNDFEKQDVGTAVKVINTKIAEGSWPSTANMTPCLVGPGNNWVCKDNCQVIWFDKCSQTKTRRASSFRSYRTSWSLSGERFETLLVYDRFINDWELMTRRKELRQLDLTSNTFKALRRTNKGVPALIRYLQEKECNASVLTAKILNDVIEARFGMYRQSPGCSYHVTVVEVMKTQKEFKSTDFFKHTKYVFCSKTAM